jgi:hypothetical protein
LAGRSFFFASAAVAVFPANMEMIFELFFAAPRFEVEIKNGFSEYFLLSRLMDWS